MHTPILIGSIGVPAETGAWANIVAISEFVNFLVVILGLFMAFRVRRILLTHLAATGNPGQGVSGVGTFFFEILHLQYRINRLVDAGVFDESSH